MTGVVELRDQRIEGGRNAREVYASGLAVDGPYLKGRHAAVTGLVAEAADCARAGPARGSTPEQLGRRTLGEELSP